MLVQIYEVTSAEEASALTKLGVDHIGVLVGKGEFPREQSIEAAKRIFVGIPPSSKGSALCLSADLSVIELVVVNLRPAILHLGASSNHSNARERQQAPVTRAQALTIARQL